jgi:hypothetical protein
LMGLRSLIRSRMFVQSSNRLNLCKKTKDIPRAIFFQLKRPYRPISILIDCTNKQIAIYDKRFQKIDFIFSVGVILTKICFLSPKLQRPSLNILVGLFIILPNFGMTVYSCLSEMRKRSLSLEIGGQGLEMPSIYSSIW